MKHRLPLVRRSLSAALLFAAASAGCTDDAPGMTDPDVDEPDTTAPSIVTTVPAASATGVAANATITITFSEEMDRGTVETAYASADLPLDQVSMEWNPAGTVLTIRPDAELEYESGIGTDPSTVTAKIYGLTIGAGAADLAGNAMTAPVALSFATKRRMLANFAIDADLTRVVRDTTLMSLANPIWIGDNSTGGTYRSYLTFDLSTLPAGSEIEAAEFVGRQAAPSGLPYSLGPVMAQHVTFATMTGVTELQAMSLPGAFSEDAVLETKRIDVTPQVQDDVINRAARGNRSQYRLQYDATSIGNNNTDTAVFTKDTFSMLALYVVD